MNYLFPLVAAFIWGGNAIVSKASAGVIAPAEIALYRWLLAFLLLTPFIAPRLWANRDAVRKQFWRLALLGCLGGAGFPILTYSAAQTTSALHIGIIQSLMPLLALGLSIALVGNRATVGALAGGIVSLVGVAIVVSHGRPITLIGHGPNVGDVLMIAATVCYAIYTVLLKRWQTAVPLLQSLYVQAAVTVIVLLPLFLLADRTGLDAANMPLVVYAGAMASVAAPLVWMTGIGRIGPARAALFFNLVPVVTAIFAVTLLGETLTPSLVFGGGLTIGGVLLAERWRAPFVRSSRRARLS